MLVRLKMMVKLAKILGPSSSTSSKRGRPRVIDTRARGTTRGRQAKIMRKMRTALGKKTKPKKYKKPPSALWEKAQEASIPARPSWDLFVPEIAETEQEPEIQIELSCEVSRTHHTSHVIYDFTSGHYEEAVSRDVLLDLLTLPSQVVLKEELERNVKASLKRRMRCHSEDSDLEDVLDDSRREMEELYEGVVSKEELARIDSQPNPFNFSDRVSQTVKIFYKDLSVQTQPPPDTRFAVTAGLGEIQLAYTKHQEEVDRVERERAEREKEKEQGSKKQNWAPLVVLGMDNNSNNNKKRPRLYRGGGGGGGLAELGRAAKVVERMVNQNIYDDILQDFKYWEDGSDEFRPLQGSLLPLWRFRPDQIISHHRHTVTALTCSRTLPDLFAAAYAYGDGFGGDDGGGGLVCVYNLKNPANPETVFHTSSGATSLHFHPTVDSLLAVGCSDGMVVVYDITPHPPYSPPPPTLHATTVTGKHLLPVTKVEWEWSEPGEEVRLVSVSVDGRVALWRLPAPITSLYHSDLLHLKTKHHDHNNQQDAIPLDGVPTSLAIHPEESHILLLGLDSGAVYQCSTTCLPHSLLHYPAHSSPVTTLAWNTRYTSLFLSASLDWCLKIWQQQWQVPLVVVDCSGSIAGAVWSPYNSSVVVAVTDDSRVHVFDLFAKQCTAVCVQPLAQRRPFAAACLAISPFYPIVFVGGERGHLASFKLSPNLRPSLKDVVDGDVPVMLAKEVERCKMDSIIRASKGGF